MTRRLAIAAAALILLAPARPTAAQDDRSAGLFARATQLPLVSQSVAVDIRGGEAVVELTQVFANPGAEIAQADYRLHLPREAVVTGFGFWSDGRYLAATLKERGEARSEHARAASEGRPTAHLQRDGRIHSFSVYPVLAGSLQEIRTTLVLPVVTESGRSHIRLPLDAFLGHAELSAGVVVRVESPEPLREIGVDGAAFVERKRTSHAAEIVFTAARPIEIRWASETEPLLTRARSVPLEDGLSAIQLRLALNDPAAGGMGPSEIVLLVDASFSMRRRAHAVEDFTSQVVDRASAPVRVLAVGERTIEIPRDDPRAISRVLADGSAGFGSSWAAIAAAADDQGCSHPRTACVVVTDPQLDGLPSGRDLETVFLADADELSHFAEIVGRSAPVHQPGVDPEAALFALADELVLPVLELESIHQGGERLDPVGAPRMRAAAGGLMRLSFEGRSSEKLRLALVAGGRSVERRIPVEEIDPSSALGRSIRRGYFRGLLDDRMAEYRRSRDPELRREIVATSLREEIPTSLTSLHMASPHRALSRTATPAPLLRLAGSILVLIGLVIGWIGLRSRP